MKRLTKVLTAAALGLSLFGCGASQNEEVKILAPSGAPALGILGAFDAENVASVETVSGSDVLQAELAKEDGEYDIIVAPSNLGRGRTTMSWPLSSPGAICIWYPPMRMRWRKRESSPLLVKGRSHSSYWNMHWISMRCR